MIILDTNIISELMKRSPNQNVIDWVDNQNTASLFITSISIAEIKYGLCMLPKGKRQFMLQEAFERIIANGFAYRVLPFTEQSAEKYGSLMAYRKEHGHPMSICDGQIASIALEHGSELATRNTKDFTDCFIELLNPFEG